MSNVVKRNGKIAFHPGSYLEELIEASGKTVRQYADMKELPFEDIRLVVAGDASVTKELASQLEIATGISQGTWLNLQRTFDEEVNEL